jgi:predicted ATPase
MITALEIENFKCFEYLRLPFGQLTLLTGFNGAGKSSAIQPLLLLAQQLRDTPDPDVFALNGAFVRLGTVADILPSSPAISVVKFTIHEPWGSKLWFLGTKSGERFIHRVRPADRITRTESTTPDPEAEDFGAGIDLARLTYLSAVREGTAEAYPIPDANSELFADVGTDGRFAAYWFFQFKDNEIPKARCHPSEPATSMRKQLDAWIAALFPGAQADARLFPELSLLSLQFRLSDIGDWRRPANVGYGISYAFPILVALLAADNGQIVVIDSPEAHLHPYAQSQMGRLLAHFAAGGVQIVVETHSDHLLNGARVAVREGVLPASSMQLHFFTGAKKEGHGVVSPALDSSGSLDEWPEGFFDQSEKDLSRLAGW